MIFNNVFSIVMTCILVGLPIFIAVFYTWNVDLLEDDDFVEKYGDIYDGLVLSQRREKRRAALFYPFWFVTRRLIFALICILAEKILWLQLSAAFFVSMVNICYLCKYRPFEESKILKLEVMNEATNFILLYHVICFGGLVPDAPGRYMLGWSFIAFLGANILVHLTLLVIETFSNCKVDCKKRCKKLCAKKPK